MAATIVVDIITDASKAVSGFKKVDDAAATTATKTQSSGSKIAGLAKAVATGFAVEKVVEFGKESISVATSVQVANARLAKVYADAGDATGEAAKHAEEYADSLGKQIGVSPVVIEQAEGMLAAFHSVNTEAGRQAGIMDGATKAAADLAAAGFGSVTSNAKLLGKALSDPAKGMTTLKRSGVALTAAQQDQIKAMEKSGNLLGAQKLLLGDVNKAVGGTAAATATSGAKMQVAMEEVQAQIGQKLLPVVNTLKGYFIGLISFISQNSSWLVPLVGGILAFAAAVKGITTATKLWAEAQAIVDALMDANPLGLIVLGIAAVIAIVVVLWNKSSAFRDFWKAVWAGILSIIQVVWSWIKANWPLLLGILLGPIALAAALIYKNWGTIKAGALAAFSWVKANWPLLLAIITGPIGLAVLAVVRNWNSIKAAAVGVWNWLAGAWGNVYSFITGPISRAVGWVEGAFNGLVGFVEGIPGDIGRAIAGVYGAVIGPFQDALNFIRNDILAPIKSVWNTVANTINGVSISTPAVKILNKTIIPSFHWSPPFHIPTLASGGVFNQATLAMVGEGSGREIVTPEGLLRQIVGEGGRGVNLTINVSVPATANPAATGRAVVDVLRAYVRANGPIPGIAAA